MRNAKQAIKSLAKLTLRQQPGLLLLLWALASLITLRAAAARAELKCARDIMRSGQRDIQVD